jgi:cytochrome bd-type quinol oxidase subunit 2
MKNMGMQAVVRKVAKIAVFVGGPLLLLGTWAFLFMHIEGTTEGFLVPWDCVPRSGRPPLGTWDRTVNDFFEIPPGSILPALIVVVFSASVFVVRSLRTTRRALLPLAFAATNAVFVLANVFLGVLARKVNDSLLPRPRPLIDVGYHHTWPVILVTTILLIVLFLVQSRLVLKRNRSFG